MCWCLKHAGSFDDCDGREEGEKECIVEVVVECSGDEGSIEAVRQQECWLTNVYTGIELLIYYSN